MHGMLKRYSRTVLHTLEPLMFNFFFLFFFFSDAVVEHFDSLVAAPDEREFGDK
jgi:hypothetical protein